ncbi:MAG: SDR family oxidoreductase [Candidatus Eiseniibacteriota bacterium]|nr:MAG: SDR family oxidoreductase [Candidatus Eisenbacteria bacterium]
MQKRRILVTGGAGYVGSHLVRKLLSRGYAVRVLDNLLFGDESVKELSSDPDFELMRGDIRHIEDVVQSMEDCYGVIHLAGIVGDPACELKPDVTHAINYEATKIMVEITKYKGLKRFVFASTCSVYGAAEDYVLNEGSVLNPVSLYAETNLRSEQIILRGFNGTDVVSSIMRLATVFGASYRMRFDLVVNILTAKAVNERKIKIYGGKQWRPNVHVEDVAEAAITLLEAPASAVDREIFNIGSNEQNYRIAELGDIVLQCIPGTQVETLDESPDPRSYNVSFDKARHVLGYRVGRTVKSGVLEIEKMFQAGLIGNFLDDIYYNVKYRYK